MQKKHVRKLANKKYRKETGLFLVQGEKNVSELLASDFVIECIFCTQEFLPTTMPHSVSCTLVTAAELCSIGTLESNDSALAVARQAPPLSMADIVSKGRNLLVLDSVRDPGNLGTLVRTADWFGIDTIIASPTTVDFYNPKVIAATMGSFLRVKVSYLELVDACRGLQKNKYSLIGATAAGGTPLGNTSCNSPYALILGSESHGLSQDIVIILDQAVTIPRVGAAESLNVSVAGGILLHALIGNNNTAPI